MIMKWLGKMFKKKKKGYNTDSQYKLLIIDEEADLLHHNLGITDERAEELLQVSIDAYDTSTVLHSALEKVVSSCKHTNEVVFVSLILQKIIDRKNHENSLFRSLRDIFRK